MGNSNFRRSSTTVQLVNPLTQQRSGLFVSALERNDETVKIHTIVPVWTSIGTYHSLETKLPLTFTLRHANSWGPAYIPSDTKTCAITLRKSCVEEGKVARLKPIELTGSFQSVYVDDKHMSNNWTQYNDWIETTLLLKDNQLVLKHSFKKDNSYPTCHEHALGIFYDEMNGKLYTMGDSK